MMTQQHPQHGRSFLLVITCIDREVVITKLYMQQHSPDHAGAAQNETIVDKEMSPVQQTRITETCTNQNWMVQRVLGKTKQQMAKAIQLNKITIINNSSNKTM